MKKQRLPIFLTVTAVFAAFTLGLFLGRNQNRGAVTVSVPAAMQTAPTQAETAPEEPEQTDPPISFPININTASKEALMALPGIGDILAERILTYRAEHGGFSSVEGLMYVEGIGEKRMEEIWELITIGG